MRKKYKLKHRKAIRRKNKLKGGISKSLIPWLFMIFISLGLIITLTALKTSRDRYTRAFAATKLSFAPPTSQASPVLINPNEQVSLDIMVDPGTNSLSFVAVVLQYDSGKLQYVDNSFQINNAAFSTILEGPLINPGSFAVKVSIGSDPTRAITAPVKLGTLAFTAIDGTGGSSTPVIYTAQSSALSIGPNDSAVENVISTTEPAYISISGSSTNPTATPPIPPTDSPLTPTLTSVPTDQPLSPTLKPTGIGAPPGDLTPTSTKPPDKPSEFKQRIIKQLEKRLAQLQRRLDKLKGRKKIPFGQIKHLEKSIDAAITRIRHVIRSVNQSDRDREVKKQVKASLKDLLAEYRQLAGNLDKFLKGMEDIAHKKRNSDKDMTRVQNKLDKMKRHISNAQKLTDKTDAGINNIITDDQLKLAIEAVAQNARLIKGELNQAADAMSTAGEELQNPK